jgi:outer membrane protein TolC
LAEPRRQAQELLKTRPEVGDVEAFGERIHVSLPAATAAQAPALISSFGDALRAAGVQVRAIRSIEPSLEDVFIAKLRAGGEAFGRGRAVLGTLLLALALGLGGNGRANAMLPAAADSLQFTLQAAIARGIEVSPKLERLRQLHGVDRGSATEARSARYPKLAANAGYSRLSEEAEFTLQSPAGEVAINPNIPDRWRLRVGVQWSIFTFGQTHKLVQAADRTQQASLRDVEAGENDLELEISSAYWQLVTQREAERVVGEALRSYDAHLQDVQHRIDVGMATRNELLSVQLERDRAELSLLEARQQLQFAQENLQRLLDVTESIRPVESLRSGEMAPLAADSLRTLQAEALAQRPERDALQARIAAAQARLGAEKAGYFPQFSLIGGWDRARPNGRIVPPEDRWEESWDAGVQLNWALFDGGRIGGAAARAAGTARALSAQLEDFDAQVRLQVAARGRELATARAAVTVAERSVESAEENMLVSRSLYDEGALTSSDLLDAETNLLRARLARTQALARHRLAEAALLHAIGRSTATTRGGASAQRQ